jgi:hypothetical protein
VANKHKKKETHKKDVSMKPDVRIEVPSVELSRGAAWLRICKRLDEVYVQYGGFIDNVRKPVWKNYQSTFSFDIFDFHIAGEIHIEEDKVIVTGNAPHFIVKKVMSLIKDELEKLLKRHTERSSL